MKLCRQILRAVLAASFSIIWMLPANAAPVVWTLDGVTRSDGGTVTGSFTYDAATNTYSAINIISTPGSSSVPAEAYGEPIPSVPPDATFLYLARTPLPSDLTNQNVIFFDYTALTDAGGTVSLNVNSSETLCASSDCTGSPVDIVSLNGQVTTEATYPILVTVAGLVPSSPPGDAENSIVLSNNGVDTFTAVDNGVFSFATELATGATYAITIDFPPDNQACTVANGSGTVGTAAITTPTVTCDPPISPTPMPTPAKPVPTLSTYGLVLTTIGLLIVAGGRLRSRRKP